MFLTDLNEVQLILIHFFDFFFDRSELIHWLFVQKQPTNRFT